MFYIVATYSAGEGDENYRSPVPATSPAQAVAKEGIDVEEHDKVYAYPIMTDPDGRCKVIRVKDE